MTAHSTYTLVLVQHPMVRLCFIVNEEANLSKHYKARKNPPLID